jgi:hypothetical protein
MKDKDIKKLKDCRKAIDKYKKSTFKDHKEKLDLSNELNQVMKGNGFVGEDGEGSVETFRKWNEQKNYEAYLECRPLQGTCDKCVGYKGTPPCQIKYDNKACVFTPGVLEQVQVTLEQIQRLCFKFYLSADSSLVETSTRRALCPEGHGWYVDKTKTKDFPFDIRWRV